MSEKTHGIIVQALKFEKEGQVLILTHTQNKVEEIEKKILESAGELPSNVTIVSWPLFLLEHVAYTNDSLTTNEDLIITGVEQRTGEPVDDYPHKIFSAHSTPLSAYLSNNIDMTLYLDMYEFVIECNKLVHGGLFKRLGIKYKHILIDELEDLKSYDLQKIRFLIQSGLSLTKTAKT